MRAWVAGMPHRLRKASRSRSRISCSVSVSIGECSPPVSTYASLPETTASCALIARHPEQADAYHDGLRRAEVPALRRVRRDEFNFQPGVDVTDVTHVKGLEFDYVVMVDVNDTSYPAVNWARHLLHIGVTRAAHQLWMVSTGEPSPLVPKALRDGVRMGVEPPAP